MEAILEPILVEPSGRLRLSFIIVDSFIGGLPDTVYQFIGPLHPFLLHGFIPGIDRFRRLLLFTQPFRNVAPQDVSRSIGGHEDFQKIAVVPPPDEVKVFHQIFKSRRDPIELRFNLIQSIRNGFLKIGVAPMLMNILGLVAHNMMGAAIANSILAAFGFFAAIKNYRKLRAAKISL